MTKEDAIKVMFYVKNHFWNDTEVNSALDMAIEALSDVPDTNVGDMISRQAKALEPKTKWILCTDQLPKIRYDVLITVWFHGKRQTKLGYRQQGEWMFWHEGNLESYLDEENKVIAWMPLPEPYKESES